MKTVSKLKRHILALALGVSLSGMDSWVVHAGSSPVQGPKPAQVQSNKGDAKPAGDAKPTGDAKQADVKCSEVKDTGAKFDISKGFSTIAEKAIPAVVNVSTTQIVEGTRPGKEGFPQFPPGTPFDDLLKEFFDHPERPRKVQSLGSGFIIQSDETSATIVTNYHVIADAKKVSVFLNDNTELDATIASFDDRTDIAILKVKTDSLPAGKRKLPTLEWGDSSIVKVGDWILAIGNPFGLGSTVTSGIISNRARDIMLGKNGGGGARSRLNDGYVDDFMQHDAAINLGNSGGPLLDLDGKVIGINTAIFSPSGGNVGIGFAIPAAVAQDTVNQLMKFGRTKRGWLGVRIQVVTDEIAESLGLGKARGAIVGSVTPDGPAAKAKIEPEDIILEFDGKEVNEKARLSRLVGETNVGKSVKVKVLRKGKEMTFDVVLGEFETAPDRTTTLPTDKSKSSINQETVKVLGMELCGLSDLSPELKNSFGKQLPKDAKGIMIMRIEDSSTALEIGLRGVERGKPGDIIEKVIEKDNQKEMTKPEDFAKAVEEAKKDKRKNILLLIYREGDLGRDEGRRFVPLKLESDDLSDKKDKSKVPSEKDNESKDKDKNKEKAEVQKAPAS